MLNDKRSVKAAGQQNRPSIIRLGRVLREQTTIYHQGDPVTGVSLVNSGVVMLYRLLENCDRQILGFYTRGDYIGLSASTAHQDTAVTLTTSSVTHISMHEVLNDMSLQRTLLTVSCQRLEQFQNLVTLLTRKSSAEKIVHFLIMLAEQQCVSGEDFDIHLPMSRLDIADYLGVSIETVSRRLTTLKSKNIISLPNRDTVHICQFQKLKEIADGL